MRKFSFLLAAATVFAGAASAQVLVIGSNIGKPCYEAALLAQSIPLASEDKCDAAIESGELNRRDLAASYINRGIIRMRSNRLDKSLEDYAEAISLRPKFGAIYLNQGAAMVSAGHYRDAIDSLNKALELDTQDPHAAHYNLGLAHELSGDETSAYYAFQKALELRPNWQLAQQQLERFTVVSEG